ncbi:MAG: hypothetical protein IKZ23_04565 [Clostridia bacterium]|nr:hypothetical protein [Clostridia bacterium]
MNKKTVFIMCITVILTICVVFLPIGLSIASYNMQMGEKTYWEYQRLGMEITPQQVAQIVHKGDFMYGPKPSYGHFDNGHYSQAATEVLAKIDAEKGDFYNFYSAFTSQQAKTFHSETYIVLTQQRPISLCVSHVEFSYNGDSLEIAYEETTKALIYFVHNCNRYIYGDFKKHHLFGDGDENLIRSSAESVFSSYYQDTLGLNDDAYFINIHSSGMEIRMGY